jgi:hypothetical protein
MAQPGNQVMSERVSRGAPVVQVLAGATFLIRHGGFKALDGAAEIAAKVAQLPGAEQKYYDSENDGELPEADTTHLFVLL